MNKTETATIRNLRAENARLRAELDQARAAADRAYTAADEAMQAAEQAQKKALDYLAQMQAGTFYTTPPQAYRHAMTNTRRSWMPRRRKF